MGIVYAAFAAPSADLQFLRADHGDLSHRGTIGTRANESLIGNDFHGGSFRCGEDHRAGLKLCLRSHRQAMQGNPAGSGQIQLRS